MDFSSLLAPPVTRIIEASYVRWPLRKNKKKVGVAIKGHFSWNYSMVTFSCVMSLKD